MAVSKHTAAPILQGYTWQADLAPVNAPAGSAVFPAGIALRAQLRTSRGADGELIGELTTANGGFERLADDRLRITISASLTADMEPGTQVFLDLIRTDTPEPLPLGITLRIPVALPVTRPS